MRVMAISIGLVRRVPREIERGLPSAVLYVKLMSPDPQKMHAKILNLARGQFRNPVGCENTGSFGLSDGDPSPICIFSQSNN